MPFSGIVPERTFIGREGTDLSGERGAGNETVGILHDLIELYGLFNVTAAAGKLLLLNDDGKFDVDALPVATAEAMGVVKAGPGISNTDGVLSVPVASNLTAGVVKVGDGLEINEEGVLSNALSPSSGGSTVTILTGTAAHGGTIPLPDGYTQDQCKWFVSVNALEEQITIFCSADTNRVVTCRSRSALDQENSQYYYKNGTANYTIWGVK